MIELPDISHLTPEEQQKILNVIKRQHDEEEKEKNMLKVLHDQFEDYKSHIKMVAEESKVTTPSEDNDPVCALCFKTKFAEGCGHICTFCEVKFCSRCGGRITIKSNKTMWVCNLCRKQKEILTKTGAWYHGENNKLAITLKPLKDTNGKENEAVKEVTETLNHRKSAEVPSVESTKDNVDKKKDEDNIATSKLRTDVVSKAKEEHTRTKPSPERQVAEMEKAETVPSMRTSSSVPHVRDPEEKPNSFYPMKGKVIPKSKSVTPVKMKAESPKSDEVTRTVSVSALELTSHKTKVPQAQTVPSRDVSSSNSHLSRRINGNMSRRADKRPQTAAKDEGRSRGCGRIHQPSVETLKRNSRTNNVESNPQSSVRMQLHGCQSEPNISGCYCRNEMQNDSSVHRKLMHRSQYNRKRMFLRDTSISSSEDEIQSTTEYSSFDDGDKETSLSDNEYLYSQRIREYPHKVYQGSYHHADHYVDNLTKSSTSLCSCQQSNSNNRDSGVESASVPYPDGSQQDQLPVSWQPSSDGRFLIGHLLLYKNMSSTSHSARQAGALLGLKVVGGKSTPSGRLGAFITKVKKGSLADTIGHLKPGDEIISWNKYCLQDASFDEVYEIVLASKEDVMVELVVSRPIKDVPRIPETRLHQTAESSSCSLDSERRDFEMCNVKPLQGKIQMRIWYDDKSQQLYVTAIRAVDLPLREGGLPRNPYLKMYPLPDRSNTFKRRTKTAKKTLTPEWMQTFVYGDVRRDDLGAMALELTLWDYDRSLEANNKFMGEVMIDLGLVCLDDEPHWFRLMPLGYGMNQDYVMENNSRYRASHVVSSETNLVEDGTSASRMVNTNRSRKMCDTVPSSPSTLRKRRLPHVPVSSSKGTIAPEQPVNQEVKHAEELTPSVKGDSGKEIMEDSFSSKTSIEFDALSVDRTFQTFVGGVGPGQIVGRQALALNSVGEIELGLYERRSQLEVKVVRARNLACKSGAKVRPAHYVKVYMLLGMQCTAKKKTKIAPRSLNPTFDQTLVFDSGQPGNALQIIVWGDYGRMDNKVFVGMVQIALDELDLTSHVIGWYKLFPTSSLIDPSAYGPRKESYSSFGSSCQTIA